MAGQLLANERPWRWAAASQIGTAHIRNGTRKQDALRCFAPRFARPVLCAIVCDGAGSAPFGGQGASVICRTLTLALRAHYNDKPQLPSDGDIWTWIDQARDYLALAAERRNIRRQAFASTLVMLIAAPDGFLVAHIGDGAVVARHKTSGWLALSWPENGEYASTTYFLTDDPMPRLRITRHDHDFDACAVFSDGIEDLALDNAASIPHEPFFRSMMAPLDQALGDGNHASLSESLGRFLDSDRVCGRTDDDKSLILASIK